MVFVKRFSTIRRGGISFIGNTLGLSKFSNLNSAGLLGSIGAFTSLDTSLKVNDFPFGTTLDYTKNGSSANLNLPAGSNVLYAELVWGGLFKSTTNNISNLLDNSISFDTNHAGWTLAVVYADENAEFRSLNLWAGGAVVSPAIGVTNIVLSGFKTPDDPVPSGKLFVSAQEGDAVISGDQMLFGEDSITFSNLSGPNNPLNNFFCSQINGDDGLINTSGTFGTRNANAQSGNNTIACRQGYDISAIDLTGKINPLQTSAAIRFTSNGDLYLPNCLAIQIENGFDANLTITKTVDKNVAVKGEQLLYTTTITNTGSSIKNNLFFSDPIPVGTTFVNGSVKGDGVSQPTYNPSTGFALADLGIGLSTIIEFNVVVN